MNETKNLGTIGINNDEPNKRPKKKLKSRWHSAVCYNSKSMAKVSRETLDQLGYSYERERTYKPYSKLMVVIPMPKFSYVFQFKVTKPSEFIINIYDTRPTHSGELHMLEILEISERNLNYVKKYLSGLANNLPRKPWKFFWAERFRYAIAATEYLRAKSAWREMGIE
jgi:hypothetical protein